MAIASAGGRGFCWLLKGELVTHAASFEAILFSTTDGRGAIFEGRHPPVLVLGASANTGQGDSHFRRVSWCCAMSRSSLLLGVSNDVVCVRSRTAPTPN